MDRLLGRDGPSLRAKGERLMSDGHHGLARHELSAAARVLGATPAGDEVRALLAACEGRLLDERLARADGLLELDHLEAAAGVLRDALDLAATDGRRADVFARLEILEKRGVALDIARDAVAGSAAPEGDEFHGESVEERLELRLGAIDDPVRADGYRRLGPEFSAAWLSLEDGDGEAAVAGLEVLAKDDASGWVRRELGRAYLLLGRHADAAAQLGPYVGDDAGGDPDAAEALAAALWRCDRADEALPVLDGVLATVPGRVSARVMLAEVYLAADQPDDACEIVEEGFALDPAARERPGSAPLYHVLGAALAAQGDDGAARTAWETGLGLAWRVDHDTGEVHFPPDTAWALATLLLRTGRDLDKALDLLRALEESAAAVPPAALWAAKARGLHALGDREAAVQAMITLRTLLAADDDEGRARVDATLAEWGDSA